MAQSLSDSSRRLETLFSELEIMKVRQKSLFYCLIFKQLNIALPLAFPIHGSLWLNVQLIQP